MSDKKEDNELNQIKVTTGDNATNVAAGKNIDQTNIYAPNNMGQVAKTINNIGPQPRRVSPEMADDLVAVLLKYPPENYAIELSMNDNEAYRLALFIERTLMRAGWTKTVQNTHMFLDVSGIIVRSPVQVSPKLQSLLQWMEVAELKNTFEWVPDSSHLWITIGANPIP